MLDTDTDTKTAIISLYTSQRKCLVGHPYPSRTPTSVSVSLLRKLTDLCQDSLPVGSFVFMEWFDHGIQSMVSLVVLKSFEVVLGHFLFVSKFFSRYLSLKVEIRNFLKALVESLQVLLEEQVTFDY